MEKTGKLITIAELIQRRRPCTGASSLCSHPNTVFSGTSSYKHQPLTGPTSSNPNSKVLTPFEHPAVLVGILALNYSHNSCFLFTDDSSEICCDILEFDVRVIGKKINVTAWNFFPLKRCKGFLEIITWKFADSSSVLSRCSSTDSAYSLPLVSGSSSRTEINAFASRYRIHGAVESISPASLVPCSDGGSLTDSTHIRGFLVRVLTCQCNLCCSKESMKIQASHLYIKPVYIFFCGAASYFHPAIVRVIGKVITVSGLKKKLIFTGKEESQLTFVTSENSVMHVPRLLKKHFTNAKNVIKGKGECGTYTGVVKGVYMQGMVVELDSEVWLLLTDKLHTMPHSLRVGAIISVHNVHFVNPRFSWAKFIILGACFKTSIVVESFSPLESGCYMNAEAQSQLGKFIESLSFPARLWALLVVSCFRKKFSGILSEKEILGSKEKKGMAQMYISSHLPSSAYQVRHGIFTEFCKHESSSCCSESYCGNLKMVMPISCIIHQCETQWAKLMSQLNNDHHDLCGNGKFNIFCCESKPFGLAKRRIFSSEDLNVVLLGVLKISPSSGRLQLADKTGSIDVIVPDLSSTCKDNSIYEVIDYSLAVEGMPQQISELQLFSLASFSCRSIFNCAPFARNRDISIFAYFLVNNSTCRDLAFYPCDILTYHSKELDSGKFHLIRVTHKFPLLKRFQGDSVITDRSSIFVEAIILHWDLVLSGNDGHGHSTKISRNHPYDLVNHSAVENYQEHLQWKRRKTEDDFYVITGLRTCSDNESDKEQSIMNLSYSHEIPCLANFRSANNHGWISSGVLGCKSFVGSKKVLLQFNAKSFFKYHLLHIGGYYIMKHDKEDIYCNVKGSDNVSGVKVLIGPKTQMWSFAFCSEEDLVNSRQLKDPSQDDTPFSDSEVLLVEQIKPFFQRSPGNAIGTSAEVHLCLPGNAKDFMKQCYADFGGDFFKSTTRPGETYSFPCTNGPELLATSCDANCMFPEGKKLISLRGDVVAIHGFDDSSSNVCESGESFGDVPHPRFLQGFARSFCIHVLVDRQSVTVFGSLREHVYLIGFEPGVNVTFHRIVDVGGQNRWMLIPVSFIVINSIRVANGPCGDKFTKQKLNSVICNKAPLGTSDLISESLKCLDCKPMRLRCRIVALYVLVLEKKNEKFDDFQLGTHSRAHRIHIPLAGFMLDDGSSSCCCWANAERAAALLGLHEELPQSALEYSGLAMNWIGISNSDKGIASYHLERILKKHERITVVNYGSMADSTYQDLTVFVSSENSLSSSDEKLLKFIILNACFRSFWTLVANVMDPSAIRWLEKEHLNKMEMTTHSMQNLWVREVHYTDPITEVRNVVQELVGR